MLSMTRRDLVQVILELLRVWLRVIEMEFLLLQIIERRLDNVCESAATHLQPCGYIRYQIRIYFRLIKAKRIETRASLFG